MIESLERRQLMHADFFAAVNFQPYNARRQSNMLIDYGSTFDARRGGLSYGWNTPQEGNAGLSPVTPVPRNNTFITMPSGTTWEIAVPDGQYKVYVVSGDPALPNQRIGILAENQVVFSGITRKAKPFLEGSATVTVTDGRLSFTGTGNATDKMNYLAVEAVHTDEPKSVSIVRTANADEDGPVIGGVLIERTGDFSQPLTVPLTMTGSATNRVDYARIGPGVTFAAGESQIRLPVIPLADDLDEGTENVVITLGAGSGYTLTQASATVSIADAFVEPEPDPELPQDLSWSSGVARPVASSESMVAEIGGDLYTFGGFVDNTFRPTATAYKFDGQTRTWSALPAMSVGLTHAGHTTDGQKVYFAGGYPGNGTNGNQTFSSTRVFSFDPATNTYAELASLPAARGAGTLGYVNGRLHFVSGNDAGRNDVSTHWSLDLSDANATWQTRAAFPVARSHAAAVTYNGQLYLVGGQTGNDEVLTAYRSLYRYDPTADAWQQLAQMATPRSHIAGSTFLRGNTIVVLAGQSAYETPLSSVEVYDLGTNTWSSRTNLPAGRFSGVAGLLSDNVIVYSAGYNGGFKSNTYYGTFS